MDDQFSKIAMYRLDDYETCFEEDIKGEYIKVKRVEQNRSGTKFACVYVDDGKFRMRIFGKEQRDPHQVKLNEIKINEMFGLNDFTMPNEVFNDPFITCCFTEEDKIFVNFYHNHSTTHYHFIWDIKFK